MKRLSLALLLLVLAVWPVCAQPVTVVGPITPGDCAYFSSVTILKDAGFQCHGSFGGTVPWANITGTPTTLAGYGITNARTALLSNVTYYVNGNSGSSAACGPTGASTCAPGNDSNTCLSPATACLTVQKIVNILIRSTDFNGFNATIYLAHGSSNNYAFTCENGPIVGQSVFFIEGDTTAPTAVTMVATTGVAVIKDLCTVSIDSVAMADNVSNNASVFISVGTGAPGHVDLSNITFGVLGIGTGLQANYSGATITLNGTNFITGSENAFIASTNGATIDVSGGTTTLIGTPAFSTAFAYIINGGSIVVNGSSFSGPATGPKCLVVGSLETNGIDPNSFPGNSNCIANNYIGQTINTQNATATTSLTLSALGSGTKVVGADGVNTGYVAATFGAPGTNSFARFDGTQASPTAVVSGDELGRLTFGGATSSSTLTGNRARFNCFAAENWSATAYGTYCSVFTSVTGGGSPTTTEKFRFQGSGGFSIGNANIAIDGGAGVVVASQYNIGASQLGCGGLANSGTGCQANTGTSGATVPFLNGSNAWSALNTFAAIGPVVAAWSATAPTISAGFCSTSPSITASNGVAAFDINVGTSCSGSVGTLAMPAATTGWVCHFEDVTTPASYVISQTGGANNTVTLTAYSRTTGLASNFTASDHIRASCIGY
jgi:hypothetical protein